jgi:hypothetical protein
MTSKSIAANRGNARRGTGPRSAAGKARSAQNACRHGLAASKSSGGVAAKVIEKLTRKLAGDAADPECLLYAGKAAEMEVMLGCICKARVKLINAHLPKQENVISVPAKQPFDAMNTAPAQEDGRAQQAPLCMTGYEEADAMLKVLPELLRLERYEAAALAGRRRALLQLSRHRQRSAERLACEQSS